MSAIEFPGAPRTRKTRGWLALVALVAAGALSACGGGNSDAVASGGTEKVSLGDFSPNVGNLNAYVAGERGFFKQEGLDVKLTQFSGGGAASIPAMVSGSAPVALAGTADVVRAIAKKILPGKFIGQQTDFGYDLIASRKYTDLKQLSKAVWGVSGAGSQDEFMIRGTLQLNGIDPNGPTFVVVGPLAARLSALAAGKVQAIAFTSSNRPTAQKAANVLLKSEDNPMKFPVVPIVANDDYINNHRPALVKLMKAIQHGTAWIKDPANRQDAIDICVKYTKAKPKACDEGIEWQINAGGPNTWSDTLAVNVDGIDKAIEAVGLVDPAVKGAKATDMVDNTIAEDAAKS